MMLGGDFLIREMWRISTRGRVLNGDRTDIALSIDVKDSVLVQIASLRNWSGPKLNEQRIRIGEVAYFHGTNLRSKKAL